MDGRGGTAAALGGRVTGASDAPPGSWRGAVTGGVLLLFLALFAVPPIRVFSGAPWFSSVEVLLLTALGLGLVLGDRRGLLGIAARPRVALALALLCVLELLAGRLAPEHGLSASYSGPGGLPQLARSIDYPGLESATRIDEVLDFDDESAGLGLRPFPLGFLDQGPHHALAPFWRDLRVPPGRQRAREAFRPSPRTRPEFSVVWRGFLHAPRDGRYVLRVDGGGSSELTVADAAPVAGGESIEVDLSTADQVPIELRHVQPEGAPVFLRLSWTPPDGEERVVPSAALLPARASEWRLRRDGFARPLRAVVAAVGALLSLLVAVRLLAPRALSEPRRWFLAVVGLALVLRLGVHLAVFAQPHAAILQGLSNDDYMHMGAASSIVLFDPLWPAGRAFHYAPVYRYFLALVQLLLGEGLRSVALAQHVLGALTCGLVYVVGRRTFSHRAGLFAAGLTAFFPLLACYESRAFMATLGAFMAMLALCAALRVKESERPRDLFAVGVLFGATLLTRPNLGLFVVPVIAWIAWQSPALRTGARRAALVVAGAVACVAPCTIKNFVASGELVVISSNGPVNLFIGNNPKATGRYMRPSRQDEDKRYVARTIEFVREHPGDWLRLLGKKLRLVLAVRALWIPYAGALLGWLLARKARIRGTLPISAGIAAVFGTPVLFFLFERFLVPGVPLLFLYCGFALDRLVPVRLWRRSPGARLLAVTGLLAACAAYLYVTVYGTAIENLVQVPWDLGRWAWLAPWVS